MPSSSSDDERIRDFATIAIKLAHPFSRNFLMPENNFGAIASERLTVRLPHGRFTTNDVPLVVTDGKAEIGDEYTLIQDASLIVNLDFVVLDDACFLGPMVYQWSISEGIGVEQAERFFSWLPKCDSTRVLLSILKTLSVPILEQNRLADNYVPEQVKNEKVWWTEKFCTALDTYCERCLAKGDDEARKLYQELRDLPDDHSTAMWLYASQPQFSQFLDLRVVPKLDNFELVVDRDSLDDLYAAGTA